MGTGLLVSALPIRRRSARKAEAAAVARHVRVGRPGVQATVEETRIATAYSRAHRQVSLVTESIIHHPQDPRYPRQNLSGSARCKMLRYNDGSIVAREVSS